MKKLLILALCLLFAVSLMYGCGKKEAEQKAEPAGGQPEEMADTTRMDSAKEMIDSAAAQGSEAANEAVEGATEQATGH
jgi:PBP1b-binding outer membrane lipoprotein LpoB